MPLLEVSRDGARCPPATVGLCMCIHSRAGQHALLSRYSIHWWLASNTACGMETHASVLAVVVVEQYRVPTHSPPRTTAIVSCDIREGFSGLIVCNDCNFFLSDTVFSQQSQNNGVFYVEEIEKKLRKQSFDRILNSQPSYAACVV